VQSGGEPALIRQKEEFMPLYMVVHPRFGDAARVVMGDDDRPQLVADIGTGSVLSIQVDNDPGSAELAAQFARELASAALRFAQRCEEQLRAPTVALPTREKDS
jgi:hypothetical protein